MFSYAGLSVVQGRLGDGPPFAGAYLTLERSLFVLVEPSSPEASEFCQEIAEFVGESFREWRLSTTGGLLRALRTVHSDLKAWNARSLHQHRVGVGVSALVIRGDEAYLAQVGPALALAYLGGESRHVVPGIPEATGPLGLVDEFYPHFSYFRVQEGDTFLLMFSAATQASEGTRLKEKLGGSLEEILGSLAKVVQSLPTFGAVVVRVRRSV